MKPYGAASPRGAKTHCLPREENITDEDRMRFRPEVTINRESLGMGPWTLCGACSNEEWMLDIEWDPQPDSYIDGDGVELCQKCVNRYWARVNPRPEPATVLEALRDSILAGCRYEALYQWARTGELP